MDRIEVSQRAVAILTTWGAADLGSATALIERYVDEGTGGVDEEMFGLVMGMMNVANLLLKRLESDHGLERSVLLQQLARDVERFGNF
jgi:hypothetical protein